MRQAFICGKLLCVTDDKICLKCDMSGRVFKVFSTCVKKIVESVLTHKNI